MKKCLPIAKGRDEKSPAAPAEVQGHPAGSGRLAQALAGVPPQPEAVRVKVRRVARGPDALTSLAAACYRKSAAASGEVPPIVISLRV